MKDDCCCDPSDGSTKSTSSRETTGSPPPESSGVGITMLAGSSGNDEQDQPIAKTVGVTKSGALKMSWEGAGKSGVLLNSNLRVVIVRGSIVDWVISGSGDWSEEE